MTLVLFILWLVTGIGWWASTHRRSVRCTSALRALVDAIDSGDLDRVDAAASHAKHILPTKDTP